MAFPSILRRYLRPALAATLIGSGTLFFIAFVAQHYPLKEWLFFRYLRVWLFSGYFLAASLTTGLRLLPFFLSGWLPRAERMVMAWALGVLVFFAGVFVAGLLNLYGPAFFFGWPTLLLAATGSSAADQLFARTDGQGESWLRRVLPGRPTQLVAALFLLLGVMAVYLQVMTPLNLGADSYWYHLPMAEYYARAGGIRRFDEGWYLGAYPQLASILYAWAFQAPGELFDHVLGCTHLEFALFLPTLLGISVLAGRLLGGPMLPWGAAAIFLFPKIFVYDSNLNGGADHILAFWAPPLALVLMRLAGRFAVREAALAALVTAGAVLTKYQASILVVPTAAFLLALAIRERRIVPLAVWGAVCLAATSPHWLKNLVYYHDPFYPLLHGIFPSTPFHPDAAKVLANVFWPKQFMPEGPLAKRLVDAAAVLATFSFVPNDWDFHGKWPVFGSVFTLLIPVLPFLRAPRRLWIVVLGVHLGIAVWYMTVHEDRFLQAVLPWMAAVTAAALTLAWRQGWMVRLAAGFLVAAQVVWGSDAYFIKSHSMIGDSPVRALGEYLGAAQKHRFQERYRFPADFEKLGAHLPPRTKVLVHQYNTRLGLDAEFATDSTGWQGGIEYLHSDSPRAAANLWREYHVNHVLWLKPRDVEGWDELAREVVFARTIERYVESDYHVDAWQIGRLRPGDEKDALAAEVTRIAYVACGAGRPDSGIYSAKGLAEERPDRRASDDELLSDLGAVNAVLVKSTCHRQEELGSALAGRFSPVLETNRYRIWVRVKRP